jgi:N-acetylneuraminic acid mutarotase
MGHTAVWAPQLGMVIFGGQAATGPYYGDAFIYSAASDTWTPVVLGASSPPGRKNHNAVWLTPGQMVVYGGFGPDAAGAYLNDLWTWDPTNSWQQPTTQPSGSARSDATAVVAGSNMIVWGGTNASPPVNDGFAFTPPSTFAPTANAPAEPESRTGHSAVVIGTQMLVFGGKSATYAFDDTLWALDTGNLAWSQLKAGPERRAFHTAVVVGKKMIVFGGDGPNGLLANGAVYDTAAP